jgi:hypothetical protein
MTAASSSSFSASALVASAASVAELSACVNQGLALVHFSAQMKDFLSLENL